MATTPASGDADISGEARLAPRADVVLREIGSGGLLVDLGTGACWELNPVGVEIWRRLCAGDTVAAASAALQRRYDAPRTRIEADVLGICRALLAARLVSAGEHPMSTP